MGNLNRNDSGAAARWPPTQFWYDRRVFGRPPINHVYRRCRCGVQVSLLQRNGYKRCSCGLQHSTTVNGVHVVSDDRAVNEPIPVPAGEPLMTADEVEHFVDLLHDDHILPMDF